MPEFISGCFNGGLSNSDDGRRVYITLGQFSIVRLERDSQLLIPVYDYCMPDKECGGRGGADAAEDPCSIFRGIAFPVGEFFPPNTRRNVRCVESAPSCGCN